MAIVVSILCVFVVVIMSLVVLYQTAKAKEQMARNMQDLVDQVNDSATYAYKFDISQDDNIKTMEKNIGMVNENVNNLANNVKVIQDNIQAFPRRYSDNIRTGVLTLGDRFSLSAVPTSNALDDEWVRLLDKEGAELRGGLAVSRMFVNDTATVNALGVQRALKLPGGKSKYNPNNKASMLPDSDGVNRLSGDTEIAGFLDTRGSLSTNDKLCIKSTCITENDLLALVNNNRPVFRFPPVLTGANTTIKGMVYTVAASSYMNAQTMPWAVFNGGHWQSAGGKYNPFGVAISSAQMPSGYVDNYGGEWIAITIPYPVHLRRYDIGGDIISFRVYGMADHAWTVLDERTLQHPPQTDILSFTLVPPAAKPMNSFVLKINRTVSATGSCTLSHLSLYGSI